MCTEIPLRQKSIVLIGFMGVGKTSIGKAVAAKLYRDFIDADQVIEEAFGMATTEIFQTYGEQVFRKKEKEIIHELCKQKLKIISLGGGAFLQEEIRSICLQKCIVFYLDLSWDSWKDRISLLIDSRPVLQGKNLTEIKQLFLERKAIYQTHHSTVQTDALMIEEVAEYIVEALKTAWDIYEPQAK
ncbi:MULTISPECIES: shikimate kinase [Clostridia]|uniref:shikimate kinase n=1 Tax=Clostridia TaxID=186801 RepID=UPI000EA3F3C3|nr:MULTISPECIES: shikimate kinase [Clostridia]NBJ69647.1 shikimate kinase [Roseburia sp. 1XD42-34]RKI78299.1 shikimate kinase [Clostridium sp. 1xD42-85]